MIVRVCRPAGSGPPKARRSCRVQRQCAHMRGFGFFVPACLTNRGFHLSLVRGISSFCYAFFPTKDLLPSGASPRPPFSYARRSPRSCRHDPRLAGPTPRSGVIELAAQRRQKVFPVETEANARWQQAGADGRGGSVPASNRCLREEKDPRKAKSCRRGIRHRVLLRRFGDLSIMNHSLTLHHGGHAGGL